MIRSEGRTEARKFKIPCPGSEILEARFAGLLYILVDIVEFFMHEGFWVLRCPWSLDDDSTA